MQALVQIVLAAMISPRERGRYSGYLGSVTSISTIGGPLLGGVIVDTSWLGWRWCFFVGVPLAVASLFLLQRTLNLPVVRRENVKIDYLGAGLIASGVSVLLIWVSFVDGSFAWASWQTAVMVAGGLALIALAVWVETRVPEPVVPLAIVKQRTSVLVIVATLSVGTAMFGATVFLSQYFQLSRGYSPTEAGLLTIPMMLGILVASTVVGRLISRTGRIKPFLVTGTALLTVGFVCLATIDHETPLAFLGAAMLCVGMGVGMTLQNLVLAVQNTVALKDIGSASSMVTFFRSLGGTVGVSVLGAVLARDVEGQVEQGTAASIAYGDATGHIFLISAGAAVLAVVAALLLKPVTLRTSLDLPGQGEAAAVAERPGDGTLGSDRVAAGPGRDD